MFNTKDQTKYIAPMCEVTESLLESVLCESADGYTEGYGDLNDYTW